MIRWNRFDIEVPDDFPVSAIESLHSHLSDRKPDATQTVEWPEWAGALNGLVYRCRSADEHFKALIESLARSDSPPQPERYRQETWLFEFFFEGHSAIECVYYGLFFVGALADSTTFDVTRDPRNINPTYVAGRYAAAFATDPLTTVLNAVASGNEFSEWRMIRNVLGHRGAPGREFVEGGPTDWKLPPPAGRFRLDVPQLERRRLWLGATVQEIARAAATFAANHVP